MQPRRVLSTKERNIVRDHEREVAYSNAPAILRGHSCVVCGALGEHFEEQCPSRALVGLPEVLRQQMQEEAVVQACGTHTMPPWYIDGGVLVPMLRTRPDVPAYLRCHVCTQLAKDAVWCQVCDTLSCSLCLAPIDAPWVCTKCGNYKETRFHVVTALRRLAEDWVRAVTLLNDGGTHLPPR